MSLHFAPTRFAEAALLLEGVPADAIEVTGNTVIDALFMEIARQEDPSIRASIDSSLSTAIGADWTTRPFVLITGHRRENFGSGFEHICRALAEIAQRSDVQIVYPVHLNPSVQEPVRRILSGVDNVFLLEPQDYLPFIYLMDRATLLLTDSGGIQEEAPSLGKPVLVMRDTTERPEAVAALSESMNLLFAAWLFGVAGVFMGACGFAGWGFHPDFLNLLS